jgi:hypothetical protein
MEIPPEIQLLCQAFLRGLDGILGEKLVAAYVHGAMAFPEAGATGDLDVHVILGGPLGESEKAGLNDLHATLARDFPPLGAGLDCYYILLEEARGTSPPRHQLLPGIVDNSWVLHCEHMRAGRCIVLHGPDPRQVCPAASWTELARALQGELDYVERHLVDYPAYCVLNLCRLMYSFDTRDVVISKRASARWAWDAFPHWRPHIEAATRSYDGRATAQDQELLRSEVKSLFEFACDSIRASLGEASAERLG